MTNGWRCRQPFLPKSRRRGSCTVCHIAPALNSGIVNIRGQLQVCVRLEGLLGLPAPAEGIPVATSTARLLVVERAGDRGPDRWVFRVDEVAGVHRVPGQ